MTSWVICNAFLNDCNQEKKQSLISFLSAEEKRMVESSSETYGNPLVDTTSTLDKLSTIHPSWLVPFVRQLAENEIRLVLSALKEEQAYKIASLLRFSFQPIALNPNTETYFQEWLWIKAMEGQKEVFPISCLPVSRMNRLLEFDLVHLIQLIDYLGLHDLAVEIKHIIDTVKLKQIYSALSKEQLAFLKTLIHQKEPVSFRLMGLSQWDGDIAHLKSLLHQRGINRIAKILFYEHPSLFWHLSHILDVERAALLSKFCSSLNHPKAIQILSEQVEETIKHVETMTQK